MPPRALPLLLAGFFFGRTPLIKLSPKKTWEGFIGGFVGTVISAFYLAKWFSQFKWMTCAREVCGKGRGGGVRVQGFGGAVFAPLSAAHPCPQPPTNPLHQASPVRDCPLRPAWLRPQDLSMGALDCTPNPIYTPRVFTAADVAEVMPGGLVDLAVYAAGLLPPGVAGWLAGASVVAEPMQVHAMVLAAFASFVAPFGERERRRGGRAVLPGVGRAPGVVRPCVCPSRARCGRESDAGTMAVVAPRRMGGPVAPPPPSRSVLTIVAWRSQADSSRAASSVPSR